MRYVCDRCGWNRKATDRDAGRKIKCPECDIYLTPPENTAPTNLAMWLTIGTVAVVVLAGIVGCAGIVVITLLSHR